MFKYAILSIILLSGNIAFSQFQLEPPEPADPRIIQAEMLLGYENVEDNESNKCCNYIHPSLLLRAGILERVELQLNVQLCTEYLRRNNHVPASFYEHTETGVPPVKAGIKTLLNEGKELIPAAALLLNVSIPRLASRYYQKTYPAPEIIFAAANVIKDLSFGSNAGILWDGETTEPYDSYVFSVSYTPIKLMAVFAESYGYYRSRTPADNRLDAGISFFITENLQLDLAAGTGLSESSPRNFLGGAIYIRFPEF
jgi:hypothetical protein